ncbi:NAD(P)-dependent oxidoreductase [Pseudoroseomonas cervicalis]|uniref:NAD(P)-dependent oxidoreductase n=1 Tax=Teichococcus cervicalis TaxID=204525 RepID=UPI00277D753F|nr:NAD(P)-dependent oxidoreductase [Pseudoroseomonas cervicalis]MDQ1080821.1 D-3-phosphoglycerate dehydrogenase [Pseudoroseomonas cervicalis]
MAGLRILLTHAPRARALYYGEAALQALAQHGTLRLNERDAPLDTAALLALAEGCDIIVADRLAAAPAALFAGLPQLAAFLRVAVDIRNVDVEAASRAGVLVCRATPGFVDSVAELALGLMIDLARGISDAVLAYRAGGAAPVRMGRQLSGATLGIIGHGAIGQRLGRLAASLGMQVLASDPALPEGAEREGARGVSFAALLAASDIVVCLAPARPETEGLMNAAAFAAMRRGALFLNLARGELVDEAALAAALESGQLGGAAMDVGRAADQMPSPSLAARPDVVATPHIGGLTPQAAHHQAFDTVRQVAALAAGRLPEQAVNPQAAHRLARLGIDDFC